MKIVLLGMVLLSISAFAFQKPVTIKEQGSFMAGGTVITAPGVYKDSEPTNYDGETFRCPCGGLSFCNKEFYKRTKKFRLRSATVQIADGKKKIWFIGGKRYCRIIEWDYL